MKKLSFFLTLLIQTGCSWIATHPIEDVEAIEVIEKSVEEIYRYETGKAFPVCTTIPAGYPPMKAVTPKEGI